MVRYFTVDRNRTLIESQTISLIKYTDIYPLEMQNHVDSLFPDGVTNHGELYVIRGSTPANGINGSLELLFEYVRRSHFPSRPSRFQSVFAFNDLDQARSFMGLYSTSSGNIWEIESALGFRADMRLLTLNGSLLNLSNNAHRYWDGISGGDSPIWEILLTPPVKVIRRVN
jgi:hypothetical protein